MDLETMESEKIYQLETTINKRTQIQVTGFSSPAAEYANERINLNNSLIKNSNTYIYQTKGDSMIDLGILPGAMVVFERRLQYFSGNVCVVRLGDELFIRELRVAGGKRYLCPANAANENYKPVEVNEFVDFEICGVVTNAINSLRRAEAKTVEPAKIKSSGVKRLAA